MFLVQRCAEIERISKESGIHTLADLFWDIWKRQGHNLPSDPSKCYLFEMCSKQFPFVVRYPEDRLILIGVRDIATLQEVEVQPFAVENDWPNWVQMKPISELLQTVPTVRPFWVRKPLPKGTTRWRNRKTRAKHNRLGMYLFSLPFFASFFLFYLFVLLSSIFI